MYFKLSKFPDYIRNVRAFTDVCAIFTAETSGPHSEEDVRRNRNLLQRLSVLPCGAMAWLSLAESAQSSEGAKLNMVYEVGELFELGIQLSYLLILLGLLGTGTFYVIRQVLVRRELDLSAKDLQVKCYNQFFVHNIIAISQKLKNIAPGISGE
jgi:hypothetical protein